MSHRPRPVQWRPVVALLALYTAVCIAAVWLGRFVSFTFSDLELYRQWATQTLTGTGPVVAGTWVYPPLAIAPMTLPALVTSTPGAYQVAWFAQVIVLNLLVLGLVYVLRPTWRPALWWYVAFTAALGPIGLGRIDAIAVPFGVAALALFATGPTTAGVLSTAGAWIKLAPGAALAAIVASSRTARIRALVGAVIVSAAVVAWCAVVWTPAAAWSFLADQQQRGLQVESVAATPFIVAATLRHLPFAQWNGQIITYEVGVPGAAQVSAWLNPLLIVVVLALVVVLAARRSDSLATVAAGALALTAALIVCNKVGSPQFATWLAAPVAAVVATDTRRWGTIIAGLGVLTAALTQVLFPFGYTHYLAASVPLVGVITVRNTLYLTLLVLAVTRIMVLGRRRR